ncbi:hypothetical protein AWENTII_008700 [Aspergillus wentii]
MFSPLGLTVKHLPIGGIAIPSIPAPCYWEGMKMFRHVNRGRIVWRDVLASHVDWFAIATATVMTSVLDECLAMLRSGLLIPFMEVCIVRVFLSSECAISVGRICGRLDA